MALFRLNFDRPGPGVKKDAPEKKGLARWWEILVRDFSSLFISNLMFFVCALPMLASTGIFYFTSLEGYPWLPALALNILFAIPLGPALAAVHRLTLQMCRNVPFFVWHEFKKAYKQNFKQGAIAMVFFAVLGDMILFSMCMMLWTEPIEPTYLGMLVLSSYIWFSMINSVFQQIALIEKSLTDIFKNAVVLVFAAGWRGVVTTLIDIGLLVFAFEYVEYFFLLTIFGLFGITIMTTNLIFWPRFETLFIKKKEPKPRAQRSVKKEWQELVEAGEKKSQKAGADEEWAREFLAERDELRKNEQPEKSPAEDTAAKDTE